MKLDRTEIYGTLEMSLAVVFDLNFQGHEIKLQKSFKDFSISCTRKHTDNCYFIINTVCCQNPG